jgi:hypothetical protein
MQIVPYILEVDGQEIILTPDVQHEYLVTTDQVALGYGVSSENIRSHKLTKADELVEGKHWVVGNTNTLGGTQVATLWTKRGIVRLGFFIRSARARKFRDLAEDLVIEKLEEATPALALISARMVGEITGQSPKAAAMMLKRYGSTPTHHFAEPARNIPAFLYPLEEVQAIYPDYTFGAYQGKVLEGLPQARRAPLAAKNTALDSLTPTQRMGADLADQIVADFIRDELPRRFKALFGSQVSA